MKDNVVGTLKVALILCIVCSVFVSTAAVVLKPSQDKNKALDRKKNILLASGLLKEKQKIDAKEVDELYKSIREMFIDLRTGELETNRKASDFDEKKESKNPALSYVIDSKKGEGEIRKIAQKAVIYHVLDGNNITGIILPIKGKGLWSTLYGFLCLSNDTQTVVGLTFYEHAETPGLGGEIDNPNWKALWPGRKVLDENRLPNFAVLKGAAGSVENDPYHVDGLSGATITSRGVSSMIRFWVGKYGYGPYLNEFRKKNPLTNTNDILNQSMEN